MPTSPLVYLKKQLGFGMGEWSKLSDADKDTLRQWAIEEMAVLGIV